MDQLSIASLKKAAHFVYKLRSDHALSAALVRLGDDPHLSDVVKLAHHHGYGIDEVSLRAATAHDWAMRWAVEVAEGRPC